MPSVCMKIKQSHGPRVALPVYAELFFFIIAKGPFNKIGIVAYGFYYCIYVRSISLYLGRQLYLIYP